MKKLIIALSILSSANAFAINGNGILSDAQYTNTYCSGYLGAVVEHTPQDTSRFNEAVEAGNFFTNITNDDKTINDNGTRDTISLDMAWRDGYNTYQAKTLKQKYKTLMPEKCLKIYSKYLQSFLMESQNEQPAK